MDEMKAMIGACESERDRTILLSEGIRQEDAIRKLEAMRPRECIECGNVNVPAAEYCSKCAAPLTEGAVKETSRKMEKVHTRPEYQQIEREYAEMKARLERLGRG